MGEQGRRRARMGIVAAMLAMLALPLPLGLLARDGPDRFRAALATAPLHGEPGVVVPPFDVVAPGPFQTAVSESFARMLFPRAPVVRFTNQVHFDLFDRALAYFNAIVVGRDGTLFERGYIENYCAPDLGGDAERLAHLVGSLTALDREMKRLGQPFVFLLTPSKAATLPGAIPAGSCGRQTARDRTVRALAGALRAAGVSFVDGVALTRAYGKKDPEPPFPRGGTHWSIAVSDRVTREVVAQLSVSAGLDLGTIRLRNWRWDHPPEGTDADLALLANLAVPPLDYATGRAEMRCRPSAAARGRDFHVVGGSFSAAVATPLATCGLFGAPTFNFYYRDRLGPEGWRQALERPAVLVVELNETYLGTTHPSGWLDPFFADILPALTADGEPG